jgi:HprK-related kinase B
LTESLRSEFSIAEYAAQLRRAQAHEARLWLRVSDFVVALRSNSQRLLDDLTAYFGSLATVSEPGRPDITITAIEADPPALPVPYREWPREPGKLGKKEAYADAADGRVICKLRTGMHFLLGTSDLLAVGPCIENSNQVVNFVISQYISRRVHEGWALCHGAGVALGDRGIGIAARAGAGKSTLALHLMSSGLSFVSNDRLLIRRAGSDDSSEMAGVPKMPRVNPGTLLNNPDLAGILPAARERELQQLPMEKVWDIEEKYDVMVDRVYGPGRCQYRAELAALLVLNWSNAASEIARFEPVDIAARSDLLSLVMKPPGVFHRNVQGRAASESAALDPAEYVSALRGVPVIEATGRADFARGVRFCRELLAARS